MLRMLLCLPLAACAVTSPEPIDSIDPPSPPADGPTGAYARLHDDAVVLHGLANVERSLRADETRCGGLASEVRITGPIGEGDRPFAEVLGLSYPTGLDFSTPSREASLQRFQLFVESMRATGEAARAHYLARLDAAAAGADKLAATARLVQIHRHIASLLVRAEVPVDVRTGDLASEKTAAFCEKLAYIATPFLTSADEAVRACLGSSAGQDGWWTAVCQP